MQRAKGDGGLVCEESDSVRTGIDTEKRPVFETLWLMRQIRQSVTSPSIDESDAVGRGSTLYFRIRRTHDDCDFEGRSNSVQAGTPDM